MDINKGGSMNDFDAPNQRPAQGQDVQQLINSVNLSRNPTVNSIQPQQQLLEVNQKKQQIFGDEDDFKRLLNQVVLKSKKVYDTESNKNPSIIKKKLSQKKQEQAKAVKAEEQKRDRILKIIESHVKNYKILNNSNSSDSEVLKMRSDLKQKTFKFLLYGIEELKLLKQTQLSEEEKRISKLTSKDPYALAKSITTEIDIEFVKNLNNMNQYIPSKKFKSFVKNFISNISDQSNLELRRKVITRQLPAKKMVTLDQQQFYPKHIREKLIQKQNFLLREAAVPQKPVVAMVDENDYATQQYQTYKSEDKKQEVKKQKYKYLQESTYEIIKDILTKQQIMKMKHLMQEGEEMRKDVKQRIINSITKVFDLGS